jgi:phospholipid-translocating ATPase
MALFNAIFTSLPVISLGVLEQDVSSQVCLQVTLIFFLGFDMQLHIKVLWSFNTFIPFKLDLQFPTLYKQGQMNIYFSWSRIIGWIMNGVVASLVIFLVNTHVLSSTAFTEEGEVADILTHFTLIQHLLIWGTILSWYIFLLLYSKRLHFFTQAIWAAPVYWMVTLLAVVLSLIPHLFYLVVQRSFCPLDDHVIQEMYHCNKDFVYNQMWQREQSKTRKTTQVGFSARVDARIHDLKQQLQQKKTSIYRSVKNSPIYKSSTNFPFL